MKWFDAISNAFKGKKEPADETRVATPDADTTQVLNKTVASSSDTIQVTRKVKVESIKSGDRVGGYEVLRTLGEGGMGRVFLVRKNGNDGGEFALKTISPDPADTATLERFRREIEIGRAINHPNVCRMLDWGEQGRIHFMVMEYLDGQVLADYIADSAPIDVERTRLLLRQLLGGLSAIHGAGAVHRDLKPGNIVLIDGGETLKIMDFGISRIAGGHSLTRTGSALGTPNFIAPEQVMDSKRVDHRADLFCVGLIAYNLLTGRLPFEAPRMQLMLQRLVANDLTPIEEFRQDLPAELTAWVRKLLANEVEARYPNADAALAEL